MHQHAQRDHEAPARRAARVDRGSEEPARGAHELVPGGTAALQRLGRPSALPFRTQLERSFGADLSDVTVRTGATEDMVRLGAGAATLQDTIVFGNDQPALHEVAHEVTHVLQNRGCAPSLVTKTVSDPHDAAEHEAASAGATVATGAGVVIGAAPAAALQLGPLDWLKGKKYGKRSKDLASMERGSGGSANPVHKVEYKGSIAGGSTKGYFKPDGGSTVSAKGNSARAVASSRLDRALGFNQLSGEEFAKHGKEKGSVSADLGVNHVPLYEGNYQAAPQFQGQTGSKLKDIDGTTHLRVGSNVFDHDYKNPLTQKSLADLQLQDAISGQVDRHGGNIMINTANGRAMGIDNDQAFDRGVDKQGYDPTNLRDGYDFNKGMPQYVDAGSAERVLGMKSKQFRKVVRGSRRDPERMDKHAADEAVKRFKDVKRHVKQLKRDDKLVSTWDDNTFDLITQDTTNGSYLREANEMQQWAQGGTDAAFTTKALPALKTPPRPTRPDPGAREAAVQQALIEAGLLSKRRPRAQMA